MKRRARHLHHMPLKWTDVFGDDFFLFWFIPTDPTFSDEDSVLGYANVCTECNLVPYPAQVHKPCVLSVSLLLGTRCLGTHGG